MFRVAFWVCFLSIVKLCLDFCVGKTILSLRLTGLSLPFLREDWVYLNAGMETEPVDSGRKAACPCVSLAGISSWFSIFFGGLPAGRMQVVVYHPGYGSLGSDLAFLLRLIGRLFCMEQKSKHKIRYHYCWN